MSTVNLLNRELGPDGVRRFRTKVKVIVHSHNNHDPINLTDSLVAFNTSKALKGVGSFSAVLTGARNWLNLIDPNDYINVYVDRGDGQGYIRLFFGFIDNIEESIITDDSGVPHTSYNVSCSDFQKAFEKTQIYFNPHVASRADFNGGFIGTPNIGGLGLMTRGVAINGSPPDLITNVVLLLMGFGSQFILPASYNPRLSDIIRQQRTDFIMNRLSADARHAILEQGSYAAYLENLRQRLQLSSSVATLTDPDDTTADGMQAAERARFRAAAQHELGGTSTGVDSDSSRGALERGIEAYNVLNTTLTGYPPSLIDVVDIFTFVERQAMDGYLVGAPTWERQGSVMSFLNSLSNEVVNELFFDLRLVSRDGGLTAGPEFSRDLDEVEGNAVGDGVFTGPQLVPAMIMREYPFSTINMLDASDISLRLRTTQGTEGDRETLGLITFGAIFSDQPNVPGRHIVMVPNMNPEDQNQGYPTGFSGAKHLDVAVIHDKQIVNSKLARSDNDHFNLFEFYSDAILGNDARFFMQDLLPIITPIHILRHGLRVRSLSTRFGRFSLDTVNRTQAQPTETDQPQAPEATEAPAGPAVHPVEEVWNSDHTRLTQGFVSQGNTWHYRNRVSQGTRSTAFNNSPNIAPPGEHIWRFHNGIDISAPRGTPVRAVRDGWVVAAAPANEDGTGRNGFSGYGSTVIIYHDQDSPPADEGTTADGAIFTLYAHMDSINSAFAPTTASRDQRFFVARELISNGRFQKVRVRAGDVIGTVGNTGFRDSGMGVHLHFEVIKRRGSRAYPSMDRTLTPDLLTSSSQLSWAPAGSQVHDGATPPANPDENLTRSQDPIRFCRDNWGLVFNVGPRVDSERSSADPPDTSGVGTDPSQVYTDDAGEFDEDPQVPAAASPTQPETAASQTTTQQVGHVDTPSTRRQLARWALLNDHWYQHNLEYLSGTIDMLGAPEIRVGYRVDLVDRNLSFYVENVSHNWTYPGKMTTTLHVTRGQPSNPYLSYVLPYINGFDPTSTQRQTASRLGKFFITPDPLSVRRSTVIAPNRGWTQGSPENPTVRASSDINETDSPGENSSLTEKYNEQILGAESVSALIDYERAARAGGGPRLASTIAVQGNPQGGIGSDVVSEMFPASEVL